MEKTTVITPMDDTGGAQLGYKLGVRRAYVQYKSGLYAYYARFRSSNAL